MSRARLSARLVGVRGRVQEEGAAPLSLHLLEIDDQAITMTVGRLEHERFLDPDRRPHIEHHARRSRLEKAEADAFDQAAAGFAGRQKIL